MTNEPVHTLQITKKIKLTDDLEIHFGDISTFLLVFKGQVIENWSYNADASKWEKNAEYVFVTERRMEPFIVPGF